MHKENDNETKL